ncbi:hypothetical protein Ancab_026414 [Ancistrocladus abbreviatus]
MVAAMAAASSLAVASSPALVSGRRRDMRRKRSFDTVIRARSSLSRIPSSTVSTTGSENGRFENRRENMEVWDKRVEQDVGGGDDRVSGSVKEYFETAAGMIGSEDGGPPRWFTPLECGGSRLDNSPLLLYLPGIDGTGLGLIKQHRRLGRMFDVWCLHIPVMDRTPFTDLVDLIETAIRSEYDHLSGRPIYLVGESIGACLSMAVAAQNPHIDLVLILANPATSFRRSQLGAFIPLLEFMPSEQFFTISNLLSLLTGDSMGLFMDAFQKGLTLPEAVGDLSEGLHSLAFYFPVIADILPRDTFMWKMQMLKLSSAYANSRLHAVKAQTLVLSSGRDPLLPNHEEGERLYRLLPKCEIRKFDDNGHFLYLEDGVDLVYTIKGASFYRRGRRHDYVVDYLPPTSSDVKRAYGGNWLIDVVTCPVMLSTLANGKIVKGLAGIPSEGPVLLVGYHMLLGFELSPMVARIFTEKNIIVRGMAHPLIFEKQREGSLPDVSAYDAFRVMGATPVSGPNIFKLLASKSHVLLYPGGVREALHRKGEEYKLFWPEQSEFVRMAARFGAKIVPFGVVGEDDIGQVVVDYNDLMRIPYFKSRIEQLTNEAVKLRTESRGEVGNQDIHLPGILPKLPGRFYYLFGKPIETEGWREGLKDRHKAHALYLHVKSEVERCIAYLKDKRESDPYRNIVPRTLYQAANGFTSDVPTFEL